MEALQQAGSAKFYETRGLMMSTLRRAALAATMGALAIPATSGEARGETFQCQRGDQIRRVELRLADDADQLPCEVVYWLDTEAPGQPQSLWNAQHQLGYCRDKAQLMVERLESAGWACDAGADDAKTDDARTDDAMAPATAAGPESPPPAPAENAPSRAAEPTARSGQPDLATLRAALERDVRRLEELTGGSSGGFATDGATLGDLNGDGLEDAAVLLTHRTAGEEPTHYLLAYLFVGETFRPIARLNIEAFYQNFADIKIEGVTQGAIQILMHVPRADDPPCCPSGRRQATFGLQDREFVLLKEIDRGA